MIKSKEYSRVREIFQKKLVRLIFWPLLVIRKLILHRLTRHYIISFPKTGRTWVRFFLAKYFYYRYEIPIYFYYKTLLKNHKSIPRFEFDHGLFHGETLREVENDIEQLTEKKILFLVRDPRDTMISFYQHIQKRQNLLNSKGLTFSEFIRHPRLGIGRMIEYMNIWLAAKNTFSEFKIISYENLKSNPERYFKEILSFLEQKEIDEESFIKSLEESSFDSMRKVEASGEVSDSKLRVSDPSDPNAYKVRAGKVGAYKEEYSKEDLEYANKCLKELDPQFGYLS